MRSCGAIAAITNGSSRLNVAFQTPVSDAARAVLIDGRGYHQFMPLLYQVASALLTTTEPDPLVDGRRPATKSPPEPPALPGPLNQVAVGGSGTTA